MLAQNLWKFEANDWSNLRPTPPEEAHTRHSRDDQDPESGKHTDPGKNQTDLAKKAMKCFLWYSGILTDCCLAKLSSQRLSLAADVSRWRDSQTDIGQSSGNSIQEGVWNDCRSQRNLKHQEKRGHRISKSWLLGAQRRQSKCLHVSVLSPLHICFGVLVELLTVELSLTPLLDFGTLFLPLDWLVKPWYGGFYLVFSLC